MATLQLGQGIVFLGQARTVDERPHKPEVTVCVLITPSHGFPLKTGF